GGEQRRGGEQTESDSQTSNLHGSSPSFGFADSTSEGPRWIALTRPSATLSRLGGRGRRELPLPLRGRGWPEGPGEGQRVELPLHAGIEPTHWISTRVTVPAA